MKWVLQKVCDWMPTRLRRLIYRAGEFFRPDDQIQFPSVEGAVKTLDAWGFRPRTMIDVGAYHGEWTTLFRRYFPEVNVLMVEAQEGKCAVLERYCKDVGGGVEVEIALLGAQDDVEVDFVELDGQTGSSVFEEASPYFDRTTVSKRLRKLDSIAAERKFDTADFLKIDVQGYELEVLKGAKSVLENAEFVLVECSLIPVNQGCPLVHEVIAFLCDNGFRLLDFCSQIRRLDGALWQTDLLFIRSTSQLVPEPRIDRTNWPVPEEVRGNLDIR